MAKRTNKNARTNKQAQTAPAPAAPKLADAPTAAPEAPPTLAEMLAATDPKALAAALAANADLAKLTKQVVADNAAAEKATKATDKAAAKLGGLRTYAVRQRAWADKAAAQAEKAADKADIADAKLDKLEKRLGVDPATDEEIAATLAELVASGRVAQLTIAEVTADAEPVGGPDAAAASEADTKLAKVAIAGAAPKPTTEGPAS